jgi:DNA-binding CsgD family transcriptional regulator
MATRAYYRMRNADLARRRVGPESWSARDRRIFEAGARGLDADETAAEMGLSVGVVRWSWQELLRREGIDGGKGELLWRFLPPLCPFERARLERGLAALAPRQQTYLCLLAAGVPARESAAYAGFTSTSEGAVAGALAWEALGLGSWAAWKPRVMLRGVEWNDESIRLREDGVLLVRDEGQGANRIAESVRAVHDGSAVRSVQDRRRGGRGHKPAGAGDEP